MLKKIVLYAFSAVILGVMMMLLPITILPPSSIETTSTAGPTTVKGEESYTDNQSIITRDTSLSFLILTALIFSLPVVATGLTIALIVFVIVSKRFK